MTEIILSTVAKAKVGAEETKWAKGERRSSRERQTQESIASPCASINAISRRANNSPDQRNGNGKD